MSRTKQSEVINFLIQNSGLNQTNFCERYDLHKGYLSNVLNDTKEYSKSTLNQICHCCGFEIELNYLLKPIKQK